MAGAVARARDGRVAGPGPLVALLGSVSILLLGMLNVREAVRPVGIPVLLPVPRGSSMGDERVVMLEFAANGDTLINGKIFWGDDLTREMMTIFSTRWVRLLRVHAGRDVPYGRVVRTIGEIEGKVPDLHALLIRDAGREAYWKGCNQPPRIR